MYIYERLLQINLSIYVASYSNITSSIYVDIIVIGCV